ncbi:putative movement protein [Hibiscus yellow blotch virus]|uniref:Putative movement protein n=1 Tax=Hibiscus yellow blotch virus TaxID=2809748 RepID=A0A890CSA7_9VIRU|nr:putative movement protein [Hibiscus yellow blotch virus]QRG34869.1 putative movement protein [Hibiscus yellow blotch virus]
MSITNSGSHASDEQELDDILNGDYSEDGVYKSSQSVCIRARNGAGIGWLTPDGLVSRLVAFADRKAQDFGFRPGTYESYRSISDVVMVVVPQVPTNAFATIELSLADSAFGPLPIDEQAVTLSSVDGPRLVVFNSAYSIPNRDRSTVTGSETHRRMGIRYSVESDARGDTTMFAITPLWRERHSPVPSYYKIGDPFSIPIRTGFKRALMATNHQMLKSLIGRGIVTLGHCKDPADINGEADLVSRENTKVNASLINSAKRLPALNSGNSTNPILRTARRIVLQPSTDGKDSVPGEANDTSK